MRTKDGRIEAINAKIARLQSEIKVLQQEMDRLLLQIEKTDSNDQP